MGARSAGARGPARALRRPRRHFGNRRLSFLKDRRLLEVVEALETQPSAREACRAAGVPEERLDVYERALAALADKGMIVAEVAA